MLFYLPFVLFFSLSVSAAENAMPETLRVSSVQMEVTENLDTNLQQILNGIDDASKAEARVVVFPETALSGFTRNAVQSLDQEKLETAMNAIAAKAKESNLYILYGCATPSGKEKPYNSAIVIAPDGSEVTRYHKMFPESWFEPGNALALFEIDGVPCTMMICHDERFPELVRIPVLNGARLCFYISYEINSLPDALRKMDGYRAQLIARAVENQIWVVQSNGIGPLGGASSVSLGQSRIIAPDGQVVSEAPALRSHLMTYDIATATARRYNALETFENEALANWWRSAFPLIKRGKVTK